MHDLNSDAQNFADEFKTSVITFDEMLKDEAIDGIAIVTSAPYLHAKLAVAALNAGKAIYIEKALAPTVKDAEMIAEAAADNGKQVMIGHLIRHHAAFQEFSQVQGGAIGWLMHIRKPDCSGPDEIQNPSF